MQRPIVAVFLYAAVLACWSNDVLAERATKTEVVNQTDPSSSNVQTEKMGKATAAISRLLDGHSIYAALEFTAEADTSHPGTISIDSDSDELTPVIAGVPYTTVVLRGKAPLSLPAGAKNLLKLVPETMTMAQAQAGNCGNTPYPDTDQVLAGEIQGTVSDGAIIWDIPAGKDNVRSMGDPSRRRSLFRIGGKFKFCYTDSGSWASGATLVPSEFSRVVVHGVSMFPGVPYTQDYRHRCFAGRIEGTNCKVRMVQIIGNTSAESDWTRTNRLTWAEPVSWEDTCGVGEALPTLGNGVASSPFMLGGQSGVVFDLGTTSNIYTPRNYWVCYCANFNADGKGTACTAKEDFTQEVGYLIIFTVTQFVATLVPATRFDIKVSCGHVNGCSQNRGNRIKILDPFSWNPELNLNNRPVWDPESGCRTLAQSIHYVSPPNCIGVTMCSPSVNGGRDVDFKIFTGLKMDNSVVSGLTETREFDVCFCDDYCGYGANWLKVGSFNISKAQLVPKAANSLEVVNTPGLVRLNTVQTDYPDTRDGITNSFASRLSNVKLLVESLEAIDVTDEECATELPPALFVNHGCVYPWQCYPFGWKNETSQIVAFNALFYHGGLQGKAFQDDLLVQDDQLRVTVLRAGIYAVCYCEDTCESPRHWAKLTRLEIRGPHLNQHWSYQTTIPFGLRVTGVGLSTSNRIKIILRTSRCDDDVYKNWDKFHVDEVYYEFFQGSVLSHDSIGWSIAGLPDGNPITGISDWANIGTTLHFEHDATGAIKAGDVLRIGNLSVDRSLEYPFLYPASAVHEEIITESWGHRITTPISDDLTGTQYGIPAMLRHPDGTIPTWSPSMRASWTRTSEELYERLESTEARLGLRVCWSDSGTAGSDFVVEAGTLDLEDAPMMTYSTANLVTTAAGEVAPLVLAFQTSVASQVRYRAAVNSMSLKIYIQDDHIEARASNLAGDELTDDHSHNDVERADQALCGKLFIELWSSHYNGFPVPKGCFYVHRDKSYVIVFGEQNGLAASTEYQIVMNTRIFALPSEPQHWEKFAAVRLWSLDDVVLRREFAVEVGQCFLNPDRLPRAAVSGTAARLSPGGFKIISQDEATTPIDSGRRLASNVLDLTLPPNLQTLTFELYANASSPIQQGHHFRLFLWPLTRWRLTESCFALCELVGEDDYQSCSPDSDEIYCKPGALCAHDTAQRNVVLLQFPLDMNPVENLSFIQVTLPNLKLPAGGMFPSHISAELSDQDHLNPHYHTSTGRLLYIPPELQFGGVVNSLAGDGNSRPFRGDLLNDLYVRLQLGATLRSQPAQDVNRLAMLTLILPDSYTCIEADVAPATLTVFGDLVPQGRGDLPKASAYGSQGAWSMHFNTCTYTLQPWGVIFAGSSIIVHLVVNNPLWSLPSADERNVWYLSMASFGAEVSTELYESGALELQGEHRAYSRNVPVQGKLIASISPLRFTPGARTNELQIFFFTEQGAGQRAKVRIDGPKTYPFDFGKRCEPGLLDELYYVHAFNMEPTYPLPGMTRQISCAGLQSTSEPWRYYGATLSLSGRLRGGYQYGFAIRVANPVQFDMSHTQEWAISTYTVDGSEIDGTYFTVPLHDRQVEKESFGIFQYQPSAADLATSFVLSLSPMLPTSVVGETAWLALGGIQFPSEASCQLRAIAPTLYEWQYASREFLYRSAQILPLLPNEGRLSDGSLLVDSTLPVGFVPAPVVEPLNVILWPSFGSFRAGKRYGFAAKIRVPNRPNTGSTNSLFLQCGFKEASLINRDLASISDVPLVAALVDVSVGYVTNIRGVSNQLRLQVRTTTALRSSGALVIQGPPGFVSQPQCVALSISHSVNQQRSIMRKRFLQYERSVQRKQIVFLTSGVDDPEYKDLTLKIELEEAELKQELAALWQDGVRANTLPIDIGCRFEEPRDTRPTVQITLQVGSPNLDVDSRMASFVRQNSPHIFDEGQALESWLPVGLYRFDVSMTNPTDIRSNEELSVDDGSPAVTAPGQSQNIILEHLTMIPCGFEQCWKFAAYKAPFSLYEPSDQAAAAVGFPIASQMREAFLVDLDMDQRRAVHRNDHPEQPNQLIFAFTLQQAIPDGVIQSTPVTQILYLKGPEEYTIPEDCSVIVARAELFGTPELWPTSLDLSNWTNETGSITGCFGIGSLATITISGGSEGLLPLRRYAFRIDILENPKATPIYNMWTLELSGHRQNKNFPRHSESSEPFYGLDQWTFLEKRIVPRTTERSTGVRTDPNGGATVNVVTVIFKPFNAVPGPGGALRFQGPNGYKMLKSTSLASNSSQAAGQTDAILCDAVLRERPVNLSSAAITAMKSGSLGVSFWDKLETTCSVHPLFPNMLLIELVGNRGVISGAEYALIASVVNPEYEITSADPFELTSRQPDPEMYQLGQTSAERSSTMALDFGAMELLDIASVPGFPVTKSVQEFTVSPWGDSSARGGVKIELRVHMQFVEPVFPNDIVRITVPPTYLIRNPSDGSSLRTDARKRCMGVDNWSKMGVLSSQQLRCYVGLVCTLEVWGLHMRRDSKVQLHRTDRFCGQLPGPDIDIRRTQANPSWDTVRKFYTLGVDMDLGHYRICYCHGDGDCTRYEDFCQEVGNLTVMDLCAGVTCPMPSSSCHTRCDPRSGSCLAAWLPALELPDGSKCTRVNETAGICEHGVCKPVNSTFIADTNAQARLLQTPRNLSSTPASCIVDIFSCSNRTLEWTVGHEGYAHSVPLNLRMAVLNPELAPPEDNDFTVAHERDGVVRSSRVVEAYEILPQLRDVSLALVGRLKAGGSLSTLELYLVPVSSATSVWLRAKEPIGFNFDFASVAENSSIISALGDTIEIAAILLPLQPLRLRIDNVRLPAQGGQGYLDVFAFNMTTLRDGAQNVPFFRTPAHVDISEAELLNQFKRDTTGDFRVEATFGNRLGEWAQLKFRLRFSNSFPANCRLRVVASSWVFSPLSASIHELRDIEAPVLVNTSLSSQGKPDEDGSASVLDIILQDALKSQREHSYMLFVDVFAPKPSDCSCWLSGSCRLCDSNWTIEILDGGMLPLATNDGLFVGFPLVSVYTWQIFTDRAPPQAFVNLTLRFTSVGAVHATRLMVTAPVGYDFPYVCMNADVSMANSLNVPYFNECIGRLNIAVLGLREDGLFRPTTVTLQVLTPRAQPSDNRWYLEGRHIAGNKQVGWGVAMGLTSEDLKKVIIDYASIESLETYFLIRLTSEVDVPDRGAIVVLPPSGYLLKCNGFLPYSMPISGLQGYRVACTELRQGVSIQFEQATLRAEMEYSFSVSGKTASLMSSGYGITDFSYIVGSSVPTNIFTVQVLERHGRVVESNFDVPASDLISYGGVLAPVLLWYDVPQVNGKLWITLSLRVPLQAPTGLSALRVTLPEGMRHAVAVTSRDHTDKGASLVWQLIPPRLNPPGTFSDFLSWTQRDQSESLSMKGANDNGSYVSRVPVEPERRRWLDLGRAHEIEVRFVSTLQFPACDLLLRFPVMLPSSMPTVNIWRVSLVFASGASGSHVASFVVPGFNFGQRCVHEMVLRAQHIFEAEGLDYFAFSQQVANGAQGLWHIVGNMQLVALAFLVDTGMYFFMQ